MLQVVCEFGFRAGGPRDQDRARVREGLCHAFEIFLVDGHMTAVACIGFVMDVLIRVGAADRFAIRFGIVEKFSLHDGRSTRMSENVCWVVACCRLASE